MSLYKKDPGSTLDYAFDWKPLTNGRAGATSDWLASGETIASYTVTAETGITKDSDSQSGGAVTVWLSAGTDETSYEIACVITTSAARIDKRTMTIHVKGR